jgi:DNA-binding MarR family transcriptional regulator
MTAEAKRSSAGLERAEQTSLARLHEAVYVFGMAERQLQARYRRARGSLSSGRVQALNVLLREEEATPSTLAAAAGLAPNTITVMLEQLERSGVVHRRRDERDRRVSWISLTDVGRAELADLRKKWDVAFLEAFGDTPDHELDVAVEVMERLARVFDDFDVPGP